MTGLQGGAGTDGLPGGAAPSPFEPEHARVGSEELLRHLSSLMDEIFWLSDARSGRMLYVSPGCERLWGVSRQNLYSNPRAWLENVHPEDRPRVEQAFRETRYHEDEYRVVRGDGTVRHWLKSRCFPIRDETGRVYRTAGMAEDVSGRRKTEEELKAKEAQLLQAQKMEAVGRLAGGVAHDFNNILTVILGYGEFLLERLEPGAPGRREIEQIRNSTKRAAGLTRRLLTFSRRQLLQKKLVDMNAVVAEMRQMLRRLIGDDIDIVVSPAAELGRVMADVGQMEQIVMNLAVNARDAMPRGGRLEIATSEESLGAPVSHGHGLVPAGRYVCVSVSDTGCGMPPEVLARLFEPFFTTKEAGKGTGLGLTIVRSIAAQSDGHVTVASHAGKGTTFKVYLPRAEGPAEAAAAEPAPARYLRGSETILLVEDERDVRELVRQALAEAGYSVLEASGAAEALWLCGKHHGPISLLLTDIIMLQMNGFEIAERLVPMQPDMKVLYMSGYMDVPVPDRWVSNVILQKPFAPSVLLGAVRDLLDAKA